MYLDLLTPPLWMNPLHIEDLETVVNVWNYLQQWHCLNWPETIQAPSKRHSAVAPGETQSHWDRGVDGTALLISIVKSLLKTILTLDFLMRMYQLKIYCNFSCKEFYAAGIRVTDYNPFLCFNYISHHDTNSCIF